MTEGGTPAWLQLADTLLQHEALRCRVVEGRAPVDFAGLFVSDDDAARILRTLPGLQDTCAEAGAGIRTPVPEDDVSRVREAFEAELAGEGRFAGVVRHARLDPASADILGLVAAVELSPLRQRLVSYVQDSVQLPRLTGPTLLAITGAAGCLAPDGPLSTSCLVTTDEQGPWATRMWGLAQRTLWHLLGAETRDPGLPSGIEVHPKRGNAAPEPDLVLVHGADRATRLALVRAHWGGGAVLVAPVPAEESVWNALVREATLRGAAVVLEAAGPLDALGRSRIQTARHLAWAVSTAHPVPLDSLPDRTWSELAARDGVASIHDWESAFGSVPPAVVTLDREQLGLVNAAAAGRTRTRWRSRTPVGRWTPRALGHAHRTAPRLG